MDASLTPAYCGLVVMTSKACASIAVCYVYFQAAFIRIPYLRVGVLQLSFEYMLLWLE